MGRLFDLRLRRGTAAAWAAANPVLNDGELAFSTDTGTLKVGDGSTAHGSLTIVGRRALVAVSGSGTSAVETTEIVTLTAAATRTLPTNPPVGTRQQYVMAGSWGATQPTLSVAAAGGGTIGGTTTAFTASTGGATITLKHRGSNVWDVDAMTSAPAVSGSLGTKLPVPSNTWYFTEEFYYAESYEDHGEGVLELALWVPHQDMQINGLGTRIGTAGSAGAVFRLAMYAGTSGNSGPLRPTGPALIDGGALAATAGGAEPIAAVGTPVQVYAGQPYFLGGANQGAASTRAIPRTARNGASLYHRTRAGVPSSGAVGTGPAFSNVPIGLRYTGVTGALPNLTGVTPSSFNAAQGGGNQIYLVGARTA